MDGDLRHASSDSSGLTADNSRGDLERHEIGIPILPVAETTSTEWTDEKHSSYLNSMEASFVNQLYRSMDLLHRRSKKNQPDLISSTPYSRILTSSGQFKVLRDGCWQNINHERSAPQQGFVDESVALAANPWIQHFRAAETNQNVMSLDEQVKAIYLRRNDTSSCGLATSSKRRPESHSHLFHQDSVGSNTEGSDQNFADEDQGEKVSNLCGAKRLKTLAVDPSTNDQVVPLANCCTTGPTENCTSSDAEHDTDDGQLN